MSNVANTRTKAFNQAMDIPLSKALLRHWRADDETSIAKYANNRRVWRNLRDAFPHPYEIDDARAYIKNYIDRLGAPGFAIEVEGEAVGSIALHPQTDVAHRSAELGYWLGEPFWNHGIMTEAVLAITDYGLRELGLVRIFATPFEWNLASVRVLEKAGYTFEGRLRKAVTKDGQTIDGLMYAFLRDD